MSSLFERVLARLGFDQAPEPTFEKLRAVYSAWCRHVPFDNVRKMIHAHSASPAPFPGSTPQDFFEAWLKYGTGGTCWAANGSFYALLEWLGFEAERGVATMLAAPNIPPNHGTVRVRFGDRHYLVDASMLYFEPLLLDENAETKIEHPAWGVQCAKRDGRWHIAWRPLHKLDGFECRLEWFGATAKDFQEAYERTRAWSPFNYSATARVNRGNEVTGFVFGHRVILHDDGSITREPITHEERQRILLEPVGLSEEIVGQLPADLPTPPPPGTQTALRQQQESAGSN